MQNSLLKIRFYQLSAFLIAFFALLLLFFLTFVLLIEIGMQYPTIKGIFQQLQVFIPAVLLVFIIVVFNIRSVDSVDIPVDNPKNIQTFQNTVDTLSKNCGINPPVIQILDHLTPTSFSIHKGFRKYIIYLTRPLFNFSNDAEINSIIAHEIGHIYSGYTASYKLMLNLLSILKFSSILNFFLFLGTLRIEFPLIWMALTTPVFLFVYNKQIATSFFFSSLLLKIFLPVLFLIDPFSQLMIFLLSYKEDSFADGRAVSILKSKAGLFSILQKIKDYKGFSADLPQKFYPLYFTREHTVTTKFLIPQPEVSKRVLKITKYKEAY